MAKEKESKLPSEGAAALMDLFSPPSNLSDEKKIEDVNSSFSSDARIQVFSQVPSQDNDKPCSTAGLPPVGSISHLQNLFAAPTKEPAAAILQKPSLITPIDRQSTTPRSNISSSKENSEITPLLSNSWKTSTQLDFYAEDTQKTFLHKKIPSVEAPVEGSLSMHTRIPSVAMPPIIESSGIKQLKNKTKKNFRTYVPDIISEASKPSTIIGSFMYTLYHIVFCLALSSAIIRPHNPTSILGLMTKTAALGTISASFVYWYYLSQEVPALYPTVDLFLAPFLANLALIVDTALANDDNVTRSENDAIFLATFGVLSAIGICFSGLLLVLAGLFKLANLGSFLPFPVICGFFAAVGILTWTLAVTVDTGGKSIGKILFSGDSELFSHFLIHHTPTVIIAVVMKYLGPKNPFYVIMVVICTIVSFYIIMIATGMSLEDAIEEGWFWSREELVYKSAEAVTIGFDNWAPPAPFGVLHELTNGLVNWGAVWQGLSTSIAMGFLYLIRCSVHGTALKKNIPNLSRKVKLDKAANKSDTSLKPNKPPLLVRPKPIKSRKFSEAVDIEAVMYPSQSIPNSKVVENQSFKVECAKPTNIPLKAILLPYGYSQFLAALAGGFAITPAVAASPTMFQLGADGLAPQIGSAILLLVFYLTDFQLVMYIPKPAFSSMLVLAFIDMIYNWFYKSYFKTKDKLEWLVVPLIVVAAFVLDLLSAVFLGLALSTFLFVAALFRSGVVKYVANGIVIHSTIERPFRSSEWLNENGDLIQVLVLQNYLFFGNASSVYNYIGILFQSHQNDSEMEDDTTNRRRPLFIVLDLTLVTGIDTSTVDVFNDINNLCASNKCKLFMAGLSSNLRTILSLGGFKVDETRERSKRQLRIFPSLDAALGKAEDNLLDAHSDEREAAGFDTRKRLLSEGDHGFRTALRHIDEEHDERFSFDLLPLHHFTTLVELKPGDGLYNEGDPLGGLERGLFFIECGVIKVEYATGATATRGTLRRSGSFNNHSASLGNYNDSLTKIQSTSLTQYSSLLSSGGDSRTFRLARIGPGWVAGTTEYISGMRQLGDHIAVTHCRLHHLPYSRLQEIEKSNPSLVLSLYKLLSYLMAKRQGATIGQLATLHSIMTSPAQLRSFG